MTMPDRTAALAWNVHIVQPLLASSAYTVPLWLPTNTRPPATVGSARAVVAFGNPNAHFSVRRGTWSGLMPAWSPGWKRLLPGSLLQAVHRAPVDGSKGGVVVHFPAIGALA